ncbi:MAG: S1/P1 nuclease [Candidatus Binatia bacterium]
MVSIFVTAIVLFNLLAVAPVFGWLDKGHRVVALIAETNLTAEARRQIEDILAPGTTLADASVWPDHEGRRLPELDPLHYVSIPENAAGYDQARDCPERNCMVEALNWFSTTVADKNAPVVARRIALRYVAHLVGDMHQPLHAGRATDSGGTEITVSYRGQTTNLHFFWDSNLVDMEEANEDDLAKRLRANLSDDRRWQAGDPSTWTNESLVLVRTYGYTTGTEGDLSDDYVENARRVVRTRLVQAGIRLAWLLNTALK